MFDASGSSAPRPSRSRRGRIPSTSPPVLVIASKRDLVFLGTHAHPVTDPDGEDRPVNMTTCNLFGGLLLTATTVGAWWAWLGWDTEKTVDPETGVTSVCRSETRRCWSGCVSVFVDDAAEHSGS